MKKVIRGHRGRHDSTPQERAGGGDALREPDLHTVGAGRCISMDPVRRLPGDLPLVEEPAGEPRHDFGPMTDPGREFSSMKSLSIMNPRPACARAGMASCRAMREGMRGVSGVAKCFTTFRDRGRPPGP